MITQVKISNFKSLFSLDVPLRPLTILVGNNDTGKSSFLRALQLLNQKQPPGIEDWFRNNFQVKFRLEQSRPGDSAYLDSPSNPGLVPPSSGFYLHPVAHYQLPTQGAPMVSDGLNEGDVSLELRPDGYGVPSLLDSLLRKDRRRFFDVVDAIKERVPGVQDIEIATPNASKRRLDLVLEDGFRMPADQASSGVRLLLFFITLAYHPSPPKLVLLEEPETGIHPKRLADVMKLLKEIACGEHGGNAAQVVLTTHSPYLLDCVDIEEDQVLVFKRNEDGTRTAEPADADRLKLFLDEFMLGEVWFNQGEEGLVRR